jgi:hypothetical protein
MIDDVGIDLTIEPSDQWSMMSSSGHRFRNHRNDSIDASMNRSPMTTSMNRSSILKMHLLLKGAVRTFTVREPSKVVGAAFRRPEGSSRRYQPALGRRPAPPAGKSVLVPFSCRCE